MLYISLLTMTFGFTEPIFVPEYWSPPTLFNLAELTGFDLESLVFSFAIAGLVSTLYDRFFPGRFHTLEDDANSSPRHRWHKIALISPAIIFLTFYLLDWFNPIYSSIIALSGGGVFASYCRPDLVGRMITSALLFGVFYWVFFLSLVWVYPEYVRHVWNLQDISGVLLLGVPLEEMLFALSFGFLWSSVYEHATWLRPVSQ